MRNCPRTSRKIGAVSHYAICAAVFGFTVHAPSAQAQEAAPAQTEASREGASDQGVYHLGPVTVGGEAIEQGYKADQSVSQKFTAPLLDTPKTVTVITRELMDQRGAMSLTDVLRTTPGITLGAGEGGTPVGDRPFIRGYEASTDIMIDGMRDLGRFSHEAFNLERVEIVKGAGSAYSGRGSTGGTINMVSKTPKLDNFLAASLTGGTDETIRGTVDANYMVSETVGLRLNLMGHDADVAGREGVTVQRWGVAPSLTLGLGTATRATLALYHLQTDDIPDLGHPFSDPSNPSRVTPPDVPKKNFYGLVDRDFRKNEATLATVTIEHDFSDTLMLRNATRYGTTQNDYIMTRPSFDLPNATEATGKVTRGFRASRRHSEMLFNQTDLTGSFSTGSVQHSFASGLEFSREVLKSGSFTNGSNPPLADLLDPDPRDPVGGSGIFDPTAYGTPTKTETIGAYVFDTVKLTEQFELNLGLRFDSYKVTSGANSRRDDRFNYQVGLVYKPVSYGSIYVSYGTSSNTTGETTGNSGGAAGAAGGAAIRGPKPERSRSIEIGTKWDVLDERLSLTAALFQTKKTDARSQDPVTGDIVLSGNNRVNGIELGIAGNITPDWQVWGSYTYLDPKILKYRSGGIDFDGNVMKFVAKQNFGIWTTYNITPAFSIGGGANFTGKRFVNDANTLYFESYWRFDATAAYKITENLDVRLNVQNLTNKTIYDASHVGFFAVVAPGRTGLLTVNARF